MSGLTVVLSRRRDLVTTGKPFICNSFFVLVLHLLAWVSVWTVCHVSGPVVLYCCFLVCREVGEAFWLVLASRFSVEWLLLFVVCVSLV